MHSTFIEYLLKTTNAIACEEIEVIQSLWSGYGKIARYRLDGSDINTVVVKHIAPNSSVNHPRGWNTTNSHRRKVKSYEVEMHWYESWSDRTNDQCRIPQFIGCYKEKDEQWVVLEDLNLQYPMRKHIVNLSEVKVCLKWLANFHLTFLNNDPDELWKIGTYWHLDTRPDEFEKMKHAVLKSKAHLIDQRLNECKYQTIVHGDAKLANFCFSEDGKSVAGVDFQYVGGGCGMKDVAYLLSSCLSSSECELYQDALLDYYFESLRNGITTSTIDCTALENEWRALYPFAWADFARFMLGWMPSHQKINPYSLEKVAFVLTQLV